MFGNWFHSPCLIVVTAALVTSLDAAIAAFLLGRSVRRIGSLDVLSISVRFAFWHAILALIGWLMASPFHGWLSRNIHWVLAAVILLVGWRAVRSFSVDQAGKDGAPPRPAAAGFDLIAMATGIDGLLVGIVAAAVGISWFAASAAAGAFALVLTTLAYVGANHLFGAGKSMVPETGKDVTARGEGYDG